MTCICVLGMHRSGTSCLTGIMQNIGVELGQVHTKNAANKRGNRENSAVVSLNEKLLKINGATWYQPVVISHWGWRHKFARKKIISILRSHPSEFWGFKDTRTLFTLDFWLEGIIKAGEEVRFIGTFRHPLQVARSLNRRDGAPIEQCLKLWQIYNTRLIELARAKDFDLVDFDLPDEEYLNDAITKLTKLGLNPEKAVKAGEFFDPRLRNTIDSDDQNEVLPADIRALYAELKDHHNEHASPADQ